MSIWLLSNEVCCRVKGSGNCTVHLRFKIGGSHNSIAEDLSLIGCDALTFGK